MKMIISADVLLVLHRVCETDQRRLLEKACGLAPISYPCLLTCPIPAGDVTNVIEQSESTAMNLYLPNGNRYTFYIMYGDFWRRSGSKWKPTLTLHPGTLIISHQIGYFDGREHHILRRSLLTGNIWESREIVIEYDSRGTHHAAIFRSNGNEMDVDWLGRFVPLRKCT